MLKWLQNDKKKTKKPNTKQATKADNPQTQQAVPQPTNTQLEHQDIIRTIAADHPQQTIQLIKHWLKD